VSDRLDQNEIIHDIRNRLAVARANIEAFIDGKLRPTPDKMKVVLDSLDDAARLLKEVKPSS
jgi:hypothetical protein